MPLTVQFQHMARRSVFKTVLHMLGLPIKLLFAVATRFASQNHVIGYDIHRHAAFDDTDVGCSFIIDAAEAHLGNAFCGNFDRVDAFFRTDAGMGFKTKDAKFHAIGGRRFGEQKTYGITVEHQTRTRAQPADVETLGADQSCFLADRENHVDVTARQPILLHHPHHFADDRHAALVIAAEDGAAVRAQNIAVQYRHDTFTGDHRVHVRGQQERLSILGVPGKMGD